MKRKIKNCREIEAREAYRTAVLANARFMWIRRLMWADLQLMLLEEWIHNHRKEAVILISEIIGCLLIMYGVVRLGYWLNAVLWG